MRTAIDLSEKLVASMEKASEKWWKSKTGTETKVGVHDGASCSAVTEAVQQSHLPMVVAAKLTSQLQTEAIQES